MKRETKATAIRMTLGRIVLLAALTASFASLAAPMKARVVQPLFAQDEKGLAESFQWTLDTLAKCDESLDLIVLPETSDVPGKVRDEKSYLDIAARNGPRLRAACAETARRCHALVFAGIVEFAADGRHYNTLVTFDRSGKEAGVYRKRHLTAGERTRRHHEDGYTKEWAKPFTVEIEGVRYAFLVCYDFYFYENYASLARVKPDVVIGSSHQRSDLHSVLGMIDSFCAYNTGAYLVRASVSMGTDSPVGGCSSVVTPKGEILADLKSRIGTADATFDPHVKYLKPMGYGNPPGLHADYIDAGRRPWFYRPGGSAIVPSLAEQTGKRLCAHRGFSAVAPENSLPAYGAAVALGAGEIEFDLWWTKDGEIVSLHDPTVDRISDGTGKVTEKTMAELLAYDFGTKQRGPHFKGLKILRFSDILGKFSCHTIFNIHVKPKRLKDSQILQMLKLIDDYDARRHVYFMTGSEPLVKSLKRLAPDIPICLGSGKRRFAQHVEDAIRLKCWGIQLFKGRFDRENLEAAKAAGLRVNVCWADDPAEARRFLEWGADTLLTNDYQPIADATGLR